MFFVVTASMSVCSNPPRRQFDLIFSLPPPLHTLSLPTTAAVSGAALQIRDRLGRRKHLLLINLPCTGTSFFIRSLTLCEAAPHVNWPV